MAYSAKAEKIAELPQINDPEQLNTWLREYCDQVLALPGWHYYGPADLIGYLADPLKIMFMGSESNGYGKCKGVHSAEYIKWFGHNTRTHVRKAALLVTMIREQIRSLQVLGTFVDFDKVKVRSLMRCERTTLLDNVRRTIYMNARITSNDRKGTGEDRAEIQRELPLFAAYRKRFVEILKPNIIICAGNCARWSLFTDLGMFPKADDKGLGVFKLRGYLVVCTRHLATRATSYEGIGRLARTCAEAFVKPTGLHSPASGEILRFGLPPRKSN